MQAVRSFVGTDVHKETIPVREAEEGRNGPVRFIGCGSLASFPTSRTTARRWPSGLRSVTSSTSVTRPRYRVISKKPPVDTPFP